MQQTINLIKKVRAEVSKYNIHSHPDYLKLKQNVYKVTNDLVPDRLTFGARMDYLLSLENDPKMLERYYTSCPCCNVIFFRDKGFNSTICNECKNNKLSFCEKHNYVHQKNTKCNKCSIEESLSEYNDSNTDEWVECKICGYRANELTSHLLKVHNIQPKEYKKQFNVEAVKSKILCDRVKGENNPGYQHGGKYSPFSENFIYVDKIDKEQLYKQATKTRKENNNDTTTIEYWLKKTNGNLQEAEILLSERQSTFSLQKCIEKYGEEEGLIRWSKRQETWQNNFPKSNYSKISQELFFAILNNIDKTFHTKIFFAEHNKEKTLNINNYVIKPDFLFDTKVIEFDGDYWHGEKRGNHHRDEFKNNLYKEGKYSLLRIKERDYLKNKNEIIQRCIQFLTQ